MLVSGSSYNIGYPINRMSRPMVTNANPPTFTKPLLVQMLHSLVSFSFGSGLCSQSSFSISSGKSNSPAEGNMLYFSDTVCVFMLSSSLPALEGVLESANGSRLYIFESLGFPSEPKLVRLDGVSVGVLGTDSSSLNRCVLEREGGRRRVSAESTGPTP